MIIVQVAYATAEKQTIITLEVAEGATAEIAINASGLLQQFPEINLENSSIGIFGEKISLTNILHAGDRVEIYRPLLVDPKQARLLRAKKKLAPL